MFKLDCYHYVVDKNGIERTYVQDAQLNPKIKLLLGEYERLIDDRLKDLSDFKYVQGAVSGAKLFNECRESAGLYNEEAFLISAHPSYTGSDLINKYLPAFEASETYCVFYSGSWRKGWLDSRVDKENLLEILEKILFITKTDKTFEFFTIELHSSSLFKIKQVNLGSSKPRWKAERTIIHE